LEVNLPKLDAETLPKVLHRKGVAGGLWIGGKPRKMGLNDAKERTMRIFSRITCWLAICLAVMSVTAGAQNKIASLERELFNATNRERMAHGVPTLRWNDSLAVAARKHAGEMAAKDTLSHQFAGEPSLPSRVKQTGARFVWLSENVALGPNPSFIHAEFVKSPPHRANILDTDMDVMGVGIVERHGQLFAVEDFSKAK
jgi:uncharacterized protein YkwD